MRQLLPVPLEDVDPAQVYGEPPRPAGRPGVRLNMIASLDGATAVDGLSGGLAGSADRRVYLALRGFADVVLVAAGTVRAERYGPPRLADDVVAARTARRQAPLPVVAVVSRSLGLDYGGPLFQDAEARPIVITVADAPADRRTRAGEVADVVMAGEGDVDLGLALAALAERGHRDVLAEGGPTLGGQLAAAGLLDELCLTISPHVVGGAAKRVLDGPAVPGVPVFGLRSLLEENGFLFARARPD